MLNIKPSGLRKNGTVEGRIAFLQWKKASAVRSDHWTLAYLADQTITKKSAVDLGKFGKGRGNKTFFLKGEATPGLRGKANKKGVLNWD